MKKITITLLSLMPLTLFAQNPMGMSQADMQKMMQQAQEAQACMEKIDQSELKRLEEKSKQFDAEMRSLCRSGKRDAAQDKAMEYMTEVMGSPVLKQAKRCGEKMQGMMQGMGQPGSLMTQDKDYTNTHVCDSY